MIDSCHSGSVFDLPYLVRLKGSRGDWVEASRVIKGTSGGFCVQFSACKDSQVAADTAALSGSVNTGACTYSFIEARGQTRHLPHILSAAVPLDTLFKAGAPVHVSCRGGSGPRHASRPTCDANLRYLAHLHCDAPQCTHRRPTAALT